MGYSLISVLVLALDIYVIYLILNGGGEPGIKLVWIIVVLLFPLLGAILYLLLGRGKTA